MSSHAYELYCRSLLFAAAVQPLRLNERNARAASQPLLQRLQFFTAKQIIDDFLGLERHLCFVNQSQSPFYKKTAAVIDVSSAVFDNALELQPSVSFVKRCGLHPESSGGKIRLQKESAYWPLE